MRHYEIVFIFNPLADLEADQVLKKINTMVTQDGGSIHRSENWGQRELSYPIENHHRAHYGLVNLECDAATLRALEGRFRYDESILRYLTIRRERAITEPSEFMNQKTSQEAATRNPEHAAPANATAETPEVRQVPTTDSL